MKVVIMKDNMNNNSKQDPSNLNSHYNHHGGGLGAAFADDGSSDRQAVAQLLSESTAPSNMSNLEYLKNLADVMAGQDVNKKSLSAAASSLSQQGNNGGFIMPSAGGGINFQGTSSNNNVTNSGPSNFAHMQNNNAGSDTDTCASNYAERRVSKDSLVSHDSLSDMLSADQVASNNLAMMNMIATQQQQMGNQNMNFNFNTNNNAIQQQQQQHQAMNQSMSQLMNHHQMSQQLKGSMMNNAMGGWNAAANNAGNNSNRVNVNDATLRNAYGVADNVNANGNTKSPLLIPPKKTKNKHKQTFAQKLMNILAVKDCQNAIRWMPNGCAFCIVDSKALVDKVLPKFFKEAKYTSFTRKLNRWGFKHFTLPTSEPSHDKEMCIYTHEMFLRDNPDLCQQMDGGHRRRNSSTSTREANIQDSAHDLGMGQASGGGGGMIQQDAQQLHQQQNMMMQQMQQLQQQNMMMQQMQQQAQQQQLPMGHPPNQAGQNAMFDMSGGGASNFNSMMFNNNSNDPISMMGSNMNLMDANGGSALGMRRTSLGFMPYLPASNRRDSGFSIGGMSAVSNDMGSSFTTSRAGNAGAGDAATGLGGGVPQQLGALGTNTHSFEKIRKMSPNPTSRGGADAARRNANFDDYKASAQGSQVSNAQGGNDRGNNNDNNDVVNQEDFHHSQAKLAVLEDMIAKERRKQSLLSSLDPDPVKMV